MEKHSKTPKIQRVFTISAILLIVVLLVTACAPAAATATSAPADTKEPQTTEQATVLPTEVIVDPTAEPSVKTGGTLTWAELGDFTSWNAWAMSGTNDIIHNMVYSRLLWKDASGEIHPDLATDWKIADDGLSMTLNLRHDVKWHDGKAFTANDFVEMFGYTKDETLKTIAGVQKINGLLKSIEDVIAVDDYTLKLTFAQPVPFIYDILDYWYAILIPDKTDGNLTKTLAVGTGPFKMTEWKTKEYVRLEKFAEYYNKDVPYLDEIVVRRLDQAETLVPNLLSGAVDGIGKVPSSYVDTIKADPNYDVMINEGSGNIVNVIVNTKLAPLDKKEVRQALSYALDRQLIADEVYYGISEPITSPFYSPATIAYREDLVMAHQFDLDKAKALLDEAGVGDFSLTFVTGTGFPEWKIYAQIWQADLAKIGITLKIDEFENAKFYEIAQSADLGGYNLAGWGTGRTKRDPAIFFQTQPQYGAGEKSGIVNPYGWYNAEYEDCVTKGRTELDPAKRAEYYQRANEILVDELPMIQVVTNPYVAGLSKTVKGLYADLLGFYGFEQVWLDR
ncbi:ABC-type dipeptide transport system, periplasmic component [Longilinea arvoryzae]|uniref:ABC-type dipeptide transport system, periplasmic component n=1 Tax=Longilinea arvoryzae TaxID=360412 RepID=A0A0S7BNX8_9CHLR|nr:ABC transporter substrate-binding protein [Longilinea arvoryzae]GAP15803.1 ABC-type dipeptide transport system, periplasmic component [Longilinea arvoryzae]